LEKKWIKETQKCAIAVTEDSATRQKKMDFKRIEHNLGMY